MTKTTPELARFPRQKEYNARQQAKGLSRITIWVPEEEREAFIEDAKLACDEHAEKTLQS